MAVDSPGEIHVIPRYTREEMGRVWSDANRYQKWLDVELAAAETLAEAGEVPKDAAVALRSRAKVDAARINELEAKVKHDVIAFTMAVGESIGDPEAARWLHYGMTSNDVVDTAQALLVRDASHIIERDLVILGEVLDVRAHEFQHTPNPSRLD
jgi:adenylosuccinate lyase